MQEQEAIKIIESELAFEVIEREKKALKVAVKALKEIRQYRAIGTVQQCREAVEKQKAKKPRLIGDAMICPSCPKVYSSDSVTYCINCGQRLDWD